MEQGGTRVLGAREFVFEPREQFVRGFRARIDVQVLVADRAVGVVRHGELEGARDDLRVHESFVAFEDVAEAFGELAQREDEARRDADGA